jgi:hypothetical protein
MICYAGISSMLFLVTAYWEQMKSQLANKKWVPSIFIVVVQLGVVILIKLAFFDRVIKSNVK